VLSGPRKGFPTGQQVEDAVLMNNFYWTGRSPQRFFVLRALEEDYRHGEPLDFDRATLTVEHVLPQSMTPEWAAILSAGASDGGPAMNRKIVNTSAWGRAEIQASMTAPISPA
jgi:hypothetical protein